MLALLLVVIFVELLFVFMVAKTQKDEQQFREQTIEGFDHPAPAVYTALAGTITAKAWTVTPSPTAKMTLTPDELF